MECEGRQVTDTGLANQILDLDGCQSELENNRGQVHLQTLAGEFCGMWEGLSLSSRDDLELASFQPHRALGKQKGESNC